MLIDTHAHINDERLLPRAAEIHESMPEKGIESLIVVGYERPSSESAVELSLKYPRFYAAVGIHPHDSKTASIEDYDRFKELSELLKTVAIGEIGLDYYYDLSDRDVQKRVFHEQIELAHSLKKPMIFHIRDAYGDALQILKEHRGDLEYGGVMHCYGGSTEMMREFVKLGLHIAFGGAVTFKNFGKAEVVKAVPADRLLLETDCPYMTPVPFRGKDNIPEYIAFVRDKIQEWRTDISVEEVTSENARTLFKLSKI